MRVLQVFRNLQRSVMFPSGNIVSFALNIRMRYFTFELIAAANDWVEQSAAATADAEARLAAVTRQYQRQLEPLESRVSREAWKFFRHGFGSESLHDARLLSLRVGDGLGFVATGKEPFFLNRRRASVIMEFLTYEQDAHFVFDLRRVSRLSCDLFVEQESYAKSIGDLYTYELTAADDDLQLGFLFASGATIVAQFRKLVFRKRRLNRRYEVGEMYR